MRHGVSGRPFTRTRTGIGLRQFFRMRAARAALTGTNGLMPWMAITARNFTLLMIKDDGQVRPNVQTLSNPGIPDTFLQILLNSLFPLQFALYHASIRWKTV